MFSSAVFIIFTVVISVHAFGNTFSLPKLSKAKNPQPLTEDVDEEGNSHEPNEKKGTVRSENEGHMEYLTQYISKSKNYRGYIENYSSFGREVKPYRNGNEVGLEYQFPLIGQHTTTFTNVFEPVEVSRNVDCFGASTQYIYPVGDGWTINTQISPGELKRELSKCGFFVNTSDWGVDYNKIIRESKEICYNIANFIVSDLNKVNKDSYENRIIAALNFVQHIPYGLPQFDTKNHVYMGIALIPESLVLGYSDCDSKSILLSSILIHMIDPEEIVLIKCTTSDGLHMITGVSGLYMQGTRTSFNGKDFLLLETTTPVGVNGHHFEGVEIIEYIPLSA